MEKIPNYSENPTPEIKFEVMESGPRVNDLDMQESQYRKAIEILKSSGVRFEGRKTMEGKTPTKTETGNQAEFAVQVMDPQDPTKPATTEYVKSIWEMLKSRGITVEWTRSVTDPQENSSSEKQ